MVQVSELPGAGASMTTETAARYEIIDRRNGDIIYTQDVASSGTTPFDHSLLGVARARESLNRAVQNNISQFLQNLETPVKEGDEISIVPAIAGGADTRIFD